MTNLPLFRRLNDDRIVEPLTDEQIRDWVAVLRTDKYMQATGALRIQPQDTNENFPECGHCCLGVLADERDLFTVYDGIQNKSGDLTVRLPLDGKMKAFHFGLASTIAGRLADLNDGEGYTFAMIADVIEAGYFEEFEDQKLPDVLLNAGFDEEWCYDHSIKGFDPYDDEPEVEY